MTKTVDGSNLGYLIGKIRAAFWAKGDTTELTIDATPTSASDNLVKSGGVYSFVGDPIVSLTVPTPNDGTVIFTHRSGDTPPRWTLTTCTCNTTARLQAVLCRWAASRLTRCTRSELSAAPSPSRWLLP